MRRSAELGDLSSRSEVVWMASCPQQPRGTSGHAASTQKLWSSVDASSSSSSVVEGTCYSMCRLMRLKKEGEQRCVGANTGYGSSASQLDAS